MEEPISDTRETRRRRLAVLLSLIGFFLLATVPVILTGRNGPSEAHDQNEHHLIVIRSMVEQWPRIEFVDYPSATSPGYHLAMSLIGRAAAPSDPAGPRGVMVMRLVNTLPSLGLLLIAWWGASRFLGPVMGAAIVTPLLLNQYFLGAAIYLTTDNAAWCFVLLAMSGLLRRRVSPAQGLGLGAAACLAVAVRQIHVWAAAPAAAASLLRSPLRRLAPAWMRPAQDAPVGGSMAIVGVLSGLAPLALLGWFVWQWEGLMPPAYRDLHNTGANPATFAFALAMAGGLGVLLAPVADLSPRRDLGSRAALSLGFVGLLAATLVETSYSERDRAYGAVWKFVQLTPDVAGRSVVILGASIVGGALLGALWSAASRRGRGPAAALLLLSALGWTLAQSFNSMAWQRYFEPFLLVLLAWLVALSRPAGERIHPARWAGVALLALAQLAISVVSLYMEVIDGG